MTNSKPFCRPFRCVPFPVVFTGTDHQDRALLSKGLRASYHEAFCSVLKTPILDHHDLVKKAIMIRFLAAGKCLSLQTHALG